MSQRAWHPIATGTLLVVLAGACRPHPQAHPEPAPTQLAASDQPGEGTRACALFTRHEDIAHLWIYPAGGRPFVQVEVGLRPRVWEPAEVPIYEHTGPFGTPGMLPRWRREWGAFATGFRRPDSLFGSRSGRLVLERVGPRLLVGRLELEAATLPTSLRDTTRAYVRVEGTFVAPRDTVFERYVYRHATQFSGPAPRHICSGAPAT